LPSGAPQELKSRGGAAGLQRIDRQNYQQCKEERHHDLVACFEAARYALGFDDNCDEHKNREPEDLQVRIDIDADENIRDLLGRFARK
jgi:hypothetical protein